MSRDGGPDRGGTEGCGKVGKFVRAERAGSIAGEVRFSSAFFLPPMLSLCTFFVCCCRPCCRSPLSFPVPPFFLFLLCSDTPIFSFSRAHPYPRPPIHLIPCAVHLFEDHQNDSQMPMNTRQATLFRDTLFCVACPHDLRTLVCCAMCGCVCDVGVCVDEGKSAERAMTS